MAPAEADPRLDRLVSLLYDAALDDHLWSGLAGKIARAFDSTSTVLKTHGAGDHVELLEVTENLVIAPKDRAWADYWHRNDLWVERSVALGLGRIGTSQDLLSDAEFERSGFYQDWTRKLGIYYMVGAAFPVDQNTIGILGIHRPKQAGAYLEHDRQRVARLLPHLNRALRMRQRLQQSSLAQRASLEALDRLDTAVVVVDECCRVLHTNGQADRVLAIASALRVKCGRLVIDDPKTGAQLVRLVSQSVRTASGAPRSSGAALSVQRADRLPITMFVAPLSPSWDRAGASLPAAIVFIRDPESVAPAHNALRELFGLTPAEAAITAALAEGQSLDQIARMFHIGLGTVRSHMKSILAKTGTHRQAQLVALIAHSVASIRSVRLRDQGGASTET